MRLLIISYFFLSSIFSFCQIQKGSKVFDLSGGYVQSYREFYNPNNSLITKNRGVYLSGYKGKAVERNLILGIGGGMSYYFSKREIDNYTYELSYVDMSRRLTFSAMGSLTYYVPIHKNWLPYLKP